MKIYSEEITKKYYDLGSWDSKVWNDYLDEHAARAPDKEAIVDQPNKEALMGLKPLRLTWTEFIKLRDRLAINFLEAGIKPEDVVYMQIPNCVEFVIMHMALHRIGAIGVCSPLRHRNKELAGTIKRTEPKYAICINNYHGVDHLGMFREVQKDYSCLKEIFVFGNNTPSGVRSVNEMLDTPPEEKYDPDYLDKFKPSADDIWLFCLTTGTEAEPKLVPWTVNTLKALGRAVLKTTGHTTDSVYSGMFPMTNMGGMGEQLSQWIIGGGKFVCHDPIDVEILMKQITEEKINYMICVPMIYIVMLNHPELNKKYDISSLGVVGCGGEPVPSWLVEEYDKLGVTVISEFGATEGFGFGTLPEQPPKDRGDLYLFEKWAKEYAPGTEIKILDVVENKIMTPPCEGELLVRGPSVFAGYYKNPEKNKECFTEDGFFRTGDQVMYYENNSFRYTGRVKDVIIRSGQNISPNEIEDLLGKHPKINLISVIGIPDKLRGQEVGVYVTLQDPKDEITMEEVNSL